MSARPHHLGSPYGTQNAEWLLARFKEWGWDAKIESYDVLFPIPKERVLERAWEIARYLVRFSPIVLRHTRRTFTQPFKRLAVDDLGFGQTMEVLGMTQFTPIGGGMKPHDRAWNDPDLWKKR